MISALMMTCVLLAGCGGRTQQEHFEDIRGAIADAGSIAFTAAVTANFEDRTEEFTLDCLRQAGDWTMTVMQPELIAGVTAHMSGAESDVVYGSVMLSTGDLTDCGILPISAAPVALDTLTESGGEAHPGRYGHGDGLVRRSGCSRRHGGGGRRCGESDLHH